VKRKLILGGMLVALVLGTVACNVVVTPSAPNGWFFLNEGSSGSGVYMNGPGTPPSGRGSALLTIDGTGREAIASATYSGLSLSTFDQLKYSTYQVAAGSTGGAPNLEFDVDYDSQDNTTAYQGRLVYVPEMSGTTVTPGVWQPWDTMTGSGAWYSSASGSSSYRPIVGGVSESAPPCNQVTFCTWATVRSDYPNARIRPTVSNVPGIFMIRVGGNDTAGSGAVDNLIIGAGGQAQFTNFEPGDGHIAVTQSNAASLGFGFAQETPNGTGAFVSGPNGADGSGSAHLTVDSAGGEAIATGVFAGTRFQDLTFLSYKTYLKAAGANAPSLQFDADYDSTDATTAFQGRAVFEPSQSGGAPITGETWQTWNPMSASSGWWQTGNAVVGGVNVEKACTQASPCSFQQLTTAYPNLAIRPITGQSAGNPIGGGIWIKAGGGWSTGFDGNVDSLTVGVKAGTTNGTVTYDFEG
jgi:hypothetical protein